MIKLLIISDDFTGALDTGVKFSAAGARTRVSTDTQIDFRQEIAEEVLVLCAPTRHLLPREAYDMIRPIAQRAVAAHIGCVYKKTDSRLRETSARNSAPCWTAAEKSAFPSFRRCRA